MTTEMTPHEDLGATAYAVPRPDPHTWPGLDRVPSGPRTRVSALVAKRLFAAAISRLPVTVHGADGPGSTLGLGGPEMTIHRPDEFFARFGRDALIGFGEAYLTGAWDEGPSGDLGGFLAVLSAEMPRLVPEPLQKLRAAVVRRPPALHRNTEKQTRGNIAHHYDLSNDLFATFLDPTLSYSSALFEARLDAVRDTVGPFLQAAPPVPGADLEAAQARKIERLLDQTGVGRGTRVLEIGTGWGELAIRAAARGATVHSVTLSSEQQALAQRRIDEAGHTEAVTVELCDYRAVQGTYDAVVSVEMIEAVGHEYWSTYFRTIDRVLAPGGRVGIQAITMPHDRMLATRRTYTWINKYIFPGGFLPSVQVLDEITRADTALRMTGRLSMGQHYAETLRQWDVTATAAAARIGALGFDETFRRMWHFYLEYSRAGFASAYLDVNQLLFTREDAR
ncbi:cyclopropane-fatty-acyl-phospholipid synthase family protein [Nocardioides sp. CFH 31398]|uniref:SAM-dependent methyltransferase n=1 Tax=Nocardioides sp. CFH 31398 TaxID=2919579 RepID=UPI001F05E864|nr:cyclopropane-fatty-acyl-phospholipid synthase family protein [Nocardioides sp. CFH 31398]MCH1867965.1 cyclopropane-fatty-acyl-phospholipid synthase family protein [Nocardioides sp. CFH 31398]